VASVYIGPAKIGVAENGNTIVLEAGRYAPCGDVVKPQGNHDNVERYFLFADTSRGCNPRIIKADKTVVNRPPYNGKPDFHTDHVYEPQTLANFLKWLATGEQVGDYHRRL
jgi:hypothetical protein